MARRKSRKNRVPEAPFADDTPTALLRRRARKALKKGEHRKAAVVFRELIALDGDAKTWTLLGDSLRRARRPAEATHALKQALYLHRQAGARLRARTVARLLSEIPA